MTGEKIPQAKNGAIDLSRSATQHGYAPGIAVFADKAAMVCGPTAQNATFAKTITAVRIGMVKHKVRDTPKQETDSSLRSGHP